VKAIIKKNGKKIVSVPRAGKKEKGILGHII